MPPVRQPLVTFSGDVRRGEIRDRPNRFILVVEFEDGPESNVYLSNTGARNVIQQGRTVLARRVESADRKTDMDAIFIKADGVWVSVDASFANTAFRSAFEQGRLPYFQDYELVRSEPPLPDGGRADFELQTPDGQEALVEVKSCSYTSEGVAKFPDRPTKRGRRHLTDLMDLQASNTETHVVFVVQRPDARSFTPYREVDPEFADTLQKAADCGVGVHAMQLEIEPPAVFLKAADLPVQLEADTI